MRPRLVAAHVRWGREVVMCGRRPWSVSAVLILVLSLKDIWESGGLVARSRRWWLALCLALSRRSTRIQGMWFSFGVGVVMR